MKRALVLFALPVFFVLAATAQTENVLYSFQGTTDGNRPDGGLVFDQAGNLYGTTIQGGDNFAGNVYQLTPPAQQGGTWTEASLYSFPGFVNDGNQPVGDLIIDSAGNLYGTTHWGGTINNNCSSGCGTVFELSPPAQQGGTWTEQLLYQFTGGLDGQYPGGLLLRNGTLYGTTTQGGHQKSYGTVFALRKVNGVWSERVLYRFKGGDDGCTPDIENLIADPAGNLYGITTACGTNGDGAVVELSPPVGLGSSWTESVLYRFQGVDGNSPHGGLVFDQAGNLYGTTTQGGGSANGNVYQLAPPVQQGGAWTETSLCSFPGFSGDGVRPAAALLVDSSGNLYGTTTSGGGSNNGGTLFELSPPAQQGGSWTEAVLHYFGVVGRDGKNPVGGLAHRDNGFVGATNSGGSRSWGTAFVVRH